MPPSRFLAPFRHSFSSRSVPRLVPFLSVSDALPAPPPRPQPAVPACLPACHPPHPPSQPAALPPTPPPPTPLFLFRFSFFFLRFFCLSFFQGERTERREHAGSILRFERELQREAEERRRKEEVERERRGTEGGGIFHGASPRNCRIAGERATIRRARQPISAHKQGNDQLIGTWSLIIDR